MNSKKATRERESGRKRGGGEKGGERERGSSSYLIKKGKRKGVYKG